MLVEYLSPSQVKCEGDLTICGGLLSTQMHRWKGWDEKCVHG